MSAFEFTEYEKEISHKMSNYLNLDENTRNLSFEILGQYKELMVINFSFSCFFFFKMEIKILTKKKNRRKMSSILSIRSLVRF